MRRGLQHRKFGLFCKPNLLVRDPDPKRPLVAALCGLCALRNDLVDAGLDLRYADPAREEVLHEAAFQSTELILM